MQTVKARFRGQNPDDRSLTIPAGEPVRIELWSEAHYYGPKIDSYDGLLPDAEDPHAGPQPNKDRPGTLKITEHGLLGDGDGVWLVAQMDEPDAVAILQVYCHSIYPHPFADDQTKYMQAKLALLVSTRTDFELL